VKAELSSGCCIGEKAFETDDESLQKRKETIKVIWTTGTAVLNKNDYIRVLKKV